VHINPIVELVVSGVTGVCHCGEGCCAWVLLVARISRAQIEVATTLDRVISLAATACISIEIVDRELTSLCMLSTIPLHQPEVDWLSLGQQFVQHSGQKVLVVTHTLCQKQ
jgi:hypothetical protein